MRIPQSGYIDVQHLYRHNEGMVTWDVIQHSQFSAGSVKSVGF